MRTLVLTHAYQLGADAPAAWREIDPANRLVWRHTPRRLDAEEIRDAMLASAGRLQLEPPAGSPARELKMIEMRDNGPEAGAIREAADRSDVRSIYLPLLRGVTPEALEAFDPVEQTLVTGQRETTTVPTQALFLLNSAFVRQQSLALAESLLAKSQATDLDRIGRHMSWCSAERPHPRRSSVRAASSGTTKRRFSRRPGLNPCIRPRPPQIPMRTTWTARNMSPRNPPSSRKTRAPPPGWPSCRRCSPPPSFDSSAEDLSGEKENPKCQNRKFRWSPAVRC